MLMLVGLSAISCASETKNETKNETKDEAKDETKSVEPLSVEGRYLVDSSGERVALHGVSFAWHNWWSEYYNAGCVNELVDVWGADVVRASMGVEHPGSYCEKPIWSEQKVCEVVDAAIAKNVYAIIDFHSHSIQKDMAIKFFTKMATKYKGVPNVIYEIFNEPMNLEWPEVKAYSIEVIKTIRAIEPNAVILVGTPTWSQDVNTAADDPIKGYSNIMYVLHFYAATHKESLREKADYAMAKGLPIFVSECAGMEASGDGPIDHESWSTWVKWMDKNSLSWVVWSISSKDETCSMLTPEAPVDGMWEQKQQEHNANVEKEEDKVEYIKPWGKLAKKYLEAYK